MTVHDKLSYFDSLENGRNVTHFGVGQTRRKSPLLNVDVHKAVKANIILQRYKILLFLQ